MPSALREAGITHDGGLDLAEFRSLLAAQLQDKLDLFETRLGGLGSMGSLTEGEGQA